MDQVTQVIKDHDTISSFFNNDTFSTIIFAIILLVIRLIERRIAKYIKASAEEKKRRKEWEQSVDERFDKHILDYTDFKARVETYQDNN